MPASPLTLAMRAAAWASPVKRQRRRYVAAMLKAIDAAADRPVPFMHAIPMSRAEGLRAIRYFEQVNGVTFDPLDGAHVRAVTGMARYGRIIRLMHRPTAPAAAP